MNSSQFKRNELKRLSSIIGFPPSQIEYIVNNIDDYYRERIEKKKDKETGEFKRYKDGTIKQRVIRPSYRELKVIQKIIKNKILVPIDLPQNVHGGVKRKSNISNAKPHQGNKFPFTTDLQDFFPNISSKKVYDTFLELKFSPHFSHWLTKLTTWKHELPQGTPTSTHIANLVFFSTDIELIKLCNLHNLTYTRYVDDITISSQHNFSHLLNDILMIITTKGFKLSYRKTKYQRKQTITGINVLLHKIEAPERIIEKANIENETNAPIKPYSNYVNNIRKTNKKTKI